MSGGSCDDWMTDLELLDEDDWPADRAPADEDDLLRRVMEGTLGARSIWNPVNEIDDPYRKLEQALNPSIPSVARKRPVQRRRSRPRRAVTPQPPPLPPPAVTPPPRRRAAPPVELMPLPPPVEEVDPGEVHPVDYSRVHQFDRDRADLERRRRR